MHPVCLVTGAHCKWQDDQWQAQAAQKLILQHGWKNVDRSSCLWQNQQGEKFHSIVHIAYVAQADWESSVLASFFSFFFSSFLSFSLFLSSLFLDSLSFSVLIYFLCFHAFLSFLFFLFLSLPLSFNPPLPLSLLSSPFSPSSLWFLEK